MSLAHNHLYVCIFVFLLLKEMKLLSCIIIKLMCVFFNFVLQMFTPVAVVFESSKKLSVGSHFCSNSPLNSDDPEEKLSKYSVSLEEKKKKVLSCFL